MLGCSRNALAVRLHRPRRRLGAALARHEAVKVLGVVSSRGSKEVI